MLHARNLLFMLPAAVAFVALPAMARRHETGFLNRVVTVSGVDYRYQVYVPPNWSKKQKWPVILFLHGAGQRGDDGLIQTEVGIGTAIRRHQDRFPAIVVMPQCRVKVWWLDTSMEAQALRALDDAMKEFKGDPARVYLTGLSMGGYGTWGLGAKATGRFAALVPICGGVVLPGHVTAREPGMAPAEATGDLYAATARGIGKTPVWAFHGSDDPAVPVTESRKLVEALKAAGGSVRYTEYPGVGHNSWEKAYAEPDLMPWLLAQRLGK
ncbi:MAG: prolyl oligopeptidase family serine peptidase [Terriglobia bacterium]